MSSSPDAAEKEIADARTELLQMHTLKVPASGGGKGSAQFALVFDNSNKPDRAEWLEGDAGLRSATDELRKKEYPVKFPDVSSIKIVRKVDVSCDGSGCVATLQALEGLQHGSSTPAQAAK
jgi:hypothetical protein